MPKMADSDARNDDLVRYPGKSSAGMRQTKPLNTWFSKHGHVDSAFSQSIAGMIQLTLVNTLTVSRSGDGTEMKQATLIILSH